jgi:hypothetical protein
LLITHSLVNLFPGFFSNHIFRQFLRLQSMFLLRLHWYCFFYLQMLKSMGYLPVSFFSPLSVLHLRWSLPTQFPGLSYYSNPHEPPVFWALDPGRAASCTSPLCGPSGTSYTYAQSLFELDVICLFGFFLTCNNPFYKWKKTDIKRDYESWIHLSRPLNLSLFQYSLSCTGLTLTQLFMSGTWVFLDFYSFIDPPESHYVSSHGSSPLKFSSKHHFFSRSSTKIS